MNIDTLHSEIKRIESIIRMNDLIPDVTGFVNYVGDEIHIMVIGREAYDEKGYWRSQKSFAGRVEEAAKLIGEAAMWAQGMPDAENRASELMIQKLTKMAAECPAGSTELVQAAWKEINRMLLSKAEQIANNGLPSPSRIASLSA